MGKQDREQQQELWIATGDLPEIGSHPFYEKLDKILAEADFDRECERMAAPYYAGNVGRPGLPPGVYVRIMLVGYFEGIESERGIAWRCNDSLSLRKFLGYRLQDPTPDHSTLSKARKRLPEEFHQAVFTMVLGLLAEKGLIRGNTIAIDASTMEANAAMKSIVRREDEQSYRQYLEKLAKEAGIKNPTAEDLKRMDRKRKKRVSNEEWKNPHDPDAKITRMKDGRTHLAYKVEHAVDLETEAIVQPSIHEADKGDTTTGPKTLDEAQQRLAEIGDKDKSFAVKAADIVMDRGYHSSALIRNCEGCGYRTYIAEPERGRRRWKRRRDEQAPNYRNRRRNRSVRGRKLQKLRASLAERPFAHLLETGGMRRTWLRGTKNVAKRYFLHAAAYNLSLVMRKLVGCGTPRGLSDLVFALMARLVSLFRLLNGQVDALLKSRRHLVLAV